MFELDFESLRRVGLTNAIAQSALQWAQTLAAPARHPPQPPMPPGRLVRITEAHRDSLRAHDGQVECRARVLPRLARALADGHTLLAVGDWVLLEVDEHHNAWVSARLPPHTHLVRRDADGRAHALVSNVDTAVLAMGLDDDFNLRRLERFIALVQGSGIQPLVVLTKADTVRDAPTLFARQQAVRERIPVRLDLMCVDARDADTAARLAPYTGAGQTLVLLGSSGAGKSTLTNTLLGRAQQDTGAVREHDSRGKHTTTARTLFMLPGGGCVIDTPGLRALRPDADAGTVAATFGDIQALAAHCRFRNCRHEDEPGCAVREGLDADRLRNYHKLLREARRDTMGALERQQLLATWKARGRAGQQRARMKRGEDG